MKSKKKTFDDHSENTWLEEPTELARAMQPNNSLVPLRRKSEKRRKRSIIQIQTGISPQDLIGL